jgi:phosphoglycolate phosphatase
MTVGLIFDFDGTLADTQGSIVEAMRLTYAEHGLAEPDEPAVVASIGLSLPFVVRAGGAVLPDDEVASVVASYRKNFTLVAPTHTRLFPGIHELLEGLALDPEVVLGIATSKPRASVESLLRHFGVLPYFDGVVCDDDVQHKKPDPEMLMLLLNNLDLETERTWMIGDTSYDLEMARAAGTGACGVAWGNHPISTLELAGAHYIAQTVGDLVNLKGQRVGVL